MPYNFEQFSITPRAAANVNVPRADIACIVRDQQTNQILADFTGANVLTFPGVILTLSNDQRRELAEMIAQWLVRTKAGLPE